MSDLIDAEWAKEKRRRRYEALKDDGAVFGLVPAEEVEFAALRKEFEEPSDDR